VPGVAQTIVVCRLRTVLELGRPRRTMACPTANLQQPTNVLKIPANAKVFQVSVPVLLDPRAKPG
jgi:hypothetical protein